jgi:transposase InsO family protein
VQRILREKKPPKRAAPNAPVVEPPDPAIPHHILRPKYINRTWHLDLTTIDFLWMRFYVAAILDGFSRKLLALRVYRDAPRARDMIRLVRRARRQFGKPRFLITDHGPQFRAEFKARMKSAGIILVRGRVQFSYRLNGKVERFFKTFRLWQRLTLFAWKLRSIQRKLDIFRDWYNTQRPMVILGNRTPEEMWRGDPIPEPTPIRQNDPVKPAFAVRRTPYRGDCQLPRLVIHMIRSVQRIA